MMGTSLCAKVLLCALLALWSWPGQVDGKNVVVVFKPGFLSIIEDFVAKFGQSKSKGIFSVGAMLTMAALENVSDLEWAAMLLEDIVAYIEEDVHLHAEGCPDVQATGADGLNNLDHLDNATALDQEYRYDASAGANVRIYIVDGGVNTGHLDFNTPVKRWTDGYCSRDCGSSPVWLDGNGHGTHVAAIALGTKHGVVKQAVLVPVKVLDGNGDGTLSSILAGLEWAYTDYVAQNSTDKAVINLSLGVDFVVQALNDAVDSLTEAGLMVTASAGNSNKDACGHSPGGSSSALCVGSHTLALAKSSSSNYNTASQSCVDMWGPGTFVSSACHSDTSGSCSRSGTSMAAPLVAGVAAHVWSLAPDLTLAELRQYLMDTAARVVEDPARGLSGMPTVQLVCQEAETTTTSTTTTSTTAEPPTTSTTVAVTTIPDDATTIPAAATTIPAAATTTPVAVTSIHPVTTTSPAADSTIPDAATTTPAAATTIPAAATTIPAAATTIRAADTTIPAAATTIRAAATTIHAAITTIPGAAATTIPAAATTVPAAGTTIPAAATTIPAAATTIPAAATTAHAAATTITADATTIPDATTTPAAATSIPADATTIPAAATTIPSAATTAPAAATTSGKGSGTGSGETGTGISTGSGKGSSIGSGKSGKSSGKSKGKSSGKSKGKSSGKSKGKSSGKSKGKSSGKSKGKSSGKSKRKAFGKSK